VDDLAVAEYVGVGKRTLKLDAGVPGGRFEAVDRDQPVARTDDPFQSRREVLERFEPALDCSQYAFTAAVCLASVIGQVRVLIDDLGIEGG
jgi:hypothetical protein